MTKAVGRFKNESEVEIENTNHDTVAEKQT